MFERKKKKSRRKALQLPTHASRFEAFKSGPEKVAEMTNDPTPRFRVKLNLGVVAHTNGEFVETHLGEEAAL